MVIMKNTSPIHDKSIGERQIIEFEQFEPDPRHPMESKYFKEIPGYSIMAFMNTFKVEEGRAHGQDLECGGGRGLGRSVEARRVFFCHDEYRGMSASIGEAM